MLGGVGSLPTIPCGLSSHTYHSNLEFLILLLHEKDEKVSSPHHRAGDSQQSQKCFATSQELPRSKREWM